MNEGDRVQIVKPFDVRSENNPDKVTTKFLEGFIYRVTARNKARLEEAVEAGDAKMAFAATGAVEAQPVGEEPAPPAAAPEARNKLGTMPPKVRGRFSSRQKG